MYLRFIIWYILRINKYVECKIQKLYSREKMYNTHLHLFLNLIKYFNNTIEYF